MKVSIALAAYNGGAYLAEQLESFAAQTRLPDELVVVDDGSRDGTPDIVRAFAARAPFPVKLVENAENLGYAQNFGKALSLCSGDLLFMSDQDDVWFDRKIEIVADLASRNPGAACLMNDALLTDGELVPAGVSKLGQIRAAGLPDTAFVMGCCAALRRELLDILLPIPEKSPSHDNWLVEVADLFGLTHRCEEPLQYYRRHGANTSNFFVNETQKPSRLDRLSRNLRQLWRRARSSDSLAKEHGFHGALDARIAERREACEQLIGSDRLGEVESKVVRRRETLEARLAIRRRGFGARPLAIITLWRKGGYRASGGVPGVLKDLIVCGSAV
ncbi:glycosyltransferase family 2 protein [Desulfuromonas sp. TF]|uniref:glycosyltransferase family 2 protein n=1 Tax=Desulfuromonas sp. TF TaxID=1232410 RepID=UPI0004865F6C|nr:glycosyltransferase family 2 protein [Desulfuromonas sp. TF]